MTTMAVNYVGTDVGDGTVELPQGTCGQVHDSVKVTVTASCVVPSGYRFFRTHGGSLLDLNSAVLSAAAAGNGAAAPSRPASQSSLPSATRSMRRRTTLAPFQNVVSRESRRKSAVAVAFSTPSTCLAVHTSGDSAVNVKIRRRDPRFRPPCHRYPSPSHWWWMRCFTTCTFRSCARSSCLRMLLFL